MTSTTEPFLCASLSLATQTVKRLSTVRENCVQSLSPESGRFPREGNGNPPQYCCLENPMDGEAWCQWGRKESDTTERLHFHFVTEHISSFIKYL